MVRYDQEQAARGARYVEDRRGRRRGSGSPGGGLPVGKVGGLGGIVVALIALLLGGNALTNNGGGGSGFDLGAAGVDLGGGRVDSRLDDAPVVDPDAQTVEYMQFLMDDIQVVWDQYFDDAGRQYAFTSLVIFDDAVTTGCGNATSAVGPFYCPAPGDNRVYIDLGFYDELATRFGAPGDFAQAYVIAHEVGHHIQSVTGISDEVRRVQAEDPGARNELSVRQELQADCLAGVWAHSASRRQTAQGLPIIEEGDISEGLRAAAAVGDDRIQASAGVDVQPHTWTHGSAEARQSWFLTGFRSGDPEQCDSFAVPASEVGL